jgi:hypothetical protein
MTYDQVTGIFRAKVSYNNRVAAGSVVGCPTRGQLRVSIDRRNWYLKDIAWLMTYGSRRWHCQTPNEFRSTWPSPLTISPPLPSAQKGLHKL